MCSDLGRDSSSFGLSFHGLTADIWFEEESWTNSQNRNVLGHPSNDGPGQPSAQPSHSLQAGLVPAQTSDTKGTKLGGWVTLEQF